MADKDTQAKADDVTEKPAAKATAKAGATKAKAETTEATKAPAAKSAPKKASSAKADEAPAKEKAPAKKAASASNTTPSAGGTLRVHHLRPAPGAKTAKTRVGRGEASKGKTAGRGTKGTKARYQVPERFEGGQMPLHMRLPKLRGFKNPARVEYQVVNLDTLAALYPQGGSVTVEDLIAKGAVRKGRLVKVLGTGEIAVSLDVAVDAFSGSAAEKIKAAGGTVTQD